MAIVKLLVAHGANVEIPTENGNTALMWAAFVGNTRVVEYLLSLGANVAHYNRDGTIPRLRYIGYSAIDLAISRMQYQSALLLYKSGAKLRKIEEYRTIVRAIFDLDKFMENLLAKKEVADETTFYIQKRKFSAKKSMNYSKGSGPGGGHAGDVEAVLQQGVELPSGAHGGAQRTSPR